MSAALILENVGVGVQELGGGARLLHLEDPITRLVVRVPMNGEAAKLLAEQLLAPTVEVATELPKMEVPRGKR